MIDGNLMLKISTLLLWRRDQSLDVVICVNARDAVSVLAAPCPCASVSIDVDFEVRPDFRARVDRLLRDELARASANCVCDARPYRPDFALMGCDSPALAAAFGVGCSLCERVGPTDPFAAARAGWIEISPVDGVPLHTHLGYCPQCSAEAAADADAEAA